MCVCVCVRLCLYNVRLDMRRGAVSGSQPISFIHTYAAYFLLLIVCLCPFFRPFSNVFFCFFVSIPVRLTSFSIWVARAPCQLFYDNDDCDDDGDDDDAADDYGRLCRQTP